MHKLKDFENILPEHSMWLLRANSLGFTCATPSQFARLNFTQQEHYISQVRNAISEYRLSNNQLNQLLFTADSNITILIINLRLALSHIEQEVIDKVYLQTLSQNSVNASTFHFHRPKVKQAISLSANHNQIHGLQATINESYFNSLESLTNLDKFLYPKKMIHVYPEQVVHSISTKIKSLFS